MPDEPTRVSAGGIGAEGGPRKAAIHIEKRMGRAVEGEMITLFFGAQLLLGRDDSCDIHIDDDRVSRKHAQIKIEGDAVRLSDLGSTNGTARNGQPVTEEIILETGDLIAFGKGPAFEARIVMRDGAVSSLRLASGTQGFLLVVQEMVIGFAGPGADDVDLKIYDPKILPRHARIEYFTGQAFIVSIDQDNPVVVNTAPVREQEIRNDYLIEIGDTLLRYEFLD